MNLALLNLTLSGDSSASMASPMLRVGSLATDSRASLRSAASLRGERGGVREALEPLQSG